MNCVVASLSRGKGGTPPAATEMVVGIVCEEVTGGSEDPRLFVSEIVVRKRLDAVLAATKNTFDPDGAEELHGTEGFINGTGAFAL